MADAWGAEDPRDEVARAVEAVLAEPTPADLGPLSGAEVARLPSALFAEYLRQRDLEQGREPQPAPVQDDDGELRRRYEAEDAISEQERWLAFAKETHAAEQAEQARLAELARAASTPAEEVESPSVFESMSDEQFSRFIAARDAGLMEIPLAGVGEDQLREAYRTYVVPGGEAEDAGA